MEATTEATMVEVAAMAAPLAMGMEVSTAYQVSSDSTSTKLKPYDWRME